MTKIAITTQSADIYSETFIRAHRDFLKGQVYFYHGGPIPQYLGDFPLQIRHLLLKSIYWRFKRLINMKVLTVEEYKFYISLKKNNPTVVLAEYGPMAVAILPLVQILRIPLVVHFHGYDASKKEFLDLYANDYKKDFNYASTIISVSDVMTQKLIALGCPEIKIIKNCCGPNDQFFNLKPEYKQPILLSVGRFVEKKAPHFAILAFNEALKKFPCAKLRMAGDGILKPVCHDLVKYLQIEGHVTFLGVLSPEEIMEEMENALVYVQHSKTAADGDMEGTPVGILEAQASALPVISTYHAGIPEVVVHGETGFLVNEGDVSGMAHFMIKILESQSEAKRLGDAGRKRVRDFFTMDKHISTLQRVLLEAVKDV